MQHQSLPSDFTALLQYRKETALLTEEPVSVTMRNACGEQPIHVFAVQGNMDGVSRCLEFGADINAPGEFDNTALHEAAVQGHVDLVEFLLGRGANPGALNEFGETPMAAVAILGDKALDNILNILGAAQRGAAPQADPKDKR